MADYIERDKALTLDFRIEVDMFGSRRKTAERAVQAYADAIAAIPAADVRPVVLCRECKFWDRERISCEGLARCNTGESGIRYRSQYDFCSRGKKREGS